VYARVEKPVIDDDNRSYETFVRGSGINANVLGMTMSEQLMENSFNVLDTES